ncbi:MAG: hypothetical protein J5372_05585 [Lachnospiraceae bacterium]|nr:hypothetical protein [Lachnospiraceae bacterium]
MPDKKRVKFKGYLLYKYLKCIYTSSKLIVTVVIHKGATFDEIRTITKKMKKMLKKAGNSKAKIKIEIGE